MIGTMPAGRQGATVRIEQEPDCLCIRPEDEGERQAVGILVNCLLGYSVEHDKGKGQQ